MSGGIRRAVLLGVSGTTSKDFGPLPCVHTDVKEVERVLEVHADGAENFEVTATVVDQNSPWSVGDLLKTLDLELEGADEFVFYFSGHGHVSKYGLQLITPEKDSLLDAGIYFDVLLHRFNHYDGPAEITIVLDCCFSGAAGDNPLAGSGVMRRYTHLRDGITILASSSHDSESFAENNMSDFTREFVACLDQAAPGSDVLDVYKWVRVNLSDQTPVIRTFGSNHSSLRSVDSVR